MNLIKYKSFFLSILIHILLIACLFYSTKDTHSITLSLPRDQLHLIMQARIINKNITNEKNDKKQAYKKLTIHLKNNNLLSNPKSTNLPKLDKKNIKNSNTSDLSVQKETAQLAKRKIKLLLKAIAKRLQIDLLKINPSFYRDLKGKVMIGFLITKNHSIKDIHIISSSGSNTLDTISLNLIKHFKLTKIKIPPIAESIRAKLPVYFEQDM